MTGSPRIVVSPPGPKAQKLLEIEKRYVSPSLSEHVPVVWKRAEGVTVTDVDDNRYLDFTSGVMIANTGHCHPKIVKAIQEQCERLLVSFDFPHDKRAILLQKLAKLMPEGMKRIILFSTGAEAVENATKIARHYSHNFEFISFHGSMHGRSYGGMSLTGLRGIKAGWGPLMTGSLHAPYAYCYRCAFGKEYPNCAMWCVGYLNEVLSKESTGSVAGLIVEPYQGNGGVVVPPKEFLPGLRKFCDAQGILLVDDEIQAGFGRTGEMFAFEHYRNARPDLLVLGKGLASGIPTSAVVGKNEIMNSLAPGTLTSTFTFNPISCAAAIASIDVMQEERIPENARTVGKHMLKRFKEMENDYDLVGEARGIGLSIGLELVKNKDTKEPAPLAASRIHKNVIKKGLLMIPPASPFNNVLRIHPPLVITKEESDIGMGIIEDELKRLA